MLSANSSVDIKMPRKSLQRISVFFKLFQDSKEITTTKKRELREDHGDPWSKPTDRAPHKVLHFFFEKYMKLFCVSFKSQIMVLSR